MTHLIVKLLQWYWNAVSGTERRSVQVVLRELPLAVTPSTVNAYLVVDQKSEFRICPFSLSQSVLKAPSVIFNLACDSSDKLRMFLRYLA